MNLVNMSLLNGTFMFGENRA